MKPLAKKLSKREFEVEKGKRFNYYSTFLKKCKESRKQKNIHHVA